MFLDEFDHIIKISIHALREEGDRVPPAFVALAENFYPRPPRGGRQPKAFVAWLLEKFLSTPSARRATSARFGCSAGKRFLSTPSARRATYFL